MTRQMPCEQPLHMSLTPTVALAKHLLGIMDVTRLQDNDRPEAIIQLCQQALNAEVKPAAICIHPEHVALAQPLLKGSGIQLTTVANFPTGQQSLDTVLGSIEESLHAGADEIDVVFPYERFLAGQTQDSADFIQRCKSACGTRLLKVIIESGQLKTAADLQDICNCIIDNGGDFIKTCTGKIGEGITEAASSSILKTLQHHPHSDTIGFKASGGIRTLQAACTYYAWVQRIRGEQFLQKDLFRMGASELWMTIQNWLAQQPSISI